MANLAYQLPPSVVVCNLNIPPALSIPIIRELLIDFAPHILINPNAYSYELDAISTFLFQTSDTSSSQLQQILNEELYFAIIGLKLILYDTDTLPEEEGHAKKG